MKLSTPWLAKVVIGKVIFLAAGSLFALDPGRSVFQYNCQNWTSQNGLPANGISAITQTTDGYIWLATQRGLIRWNGTEFKVLSLNQPQFQGQGVNSLSAARNGGLWFGVEGGRFGFCDGQAISLPRDIEWATPGLSTHVIRETRDGSVWVGAESGLGHWVNGDAKGTSFDEKLPQIESVYEDSRGRIWFGSAEHGLSYWHEGRMIAFPDGSLNAATINAVVEDTAGLLWVGTHAGLLCYDANFQPRSIPALVNEIRALLVDRHGTLWIGTSGSGLVRYESGAYTFFQKKNGLANDFVTALFEDREGSLWVGTQEGLSQFTDLKFPIFSAAEGLPPGSSHGVCASQSGGLWVAMSQGVSYLSAAGITNYGTAAGISNLYVKRVFEAANGDVYLIDGGKRLEILSGGNVVARYTNQTWPVAMIENALGVVVSIGDSLFRFREGRLVPYTFNGGSSPPMYWIYNLGMGRDDAILVASVNGVFRIKDGNFQQWSVPDGLSGGKAYWVCEDSDGAIWAGLATGIARIKNGQVRNIGRENGLFDDIVFAIIPDDQGYFWMSSPRGIFRVSRQSLDNYADGKADHVVCEIYDGPSAVKTSERTDQEASGCKTRDGRIWFPSPQGVVMIDPANLFTNLVPPMVRIEQIRINGLELKDRKIPDLHPGRKDMEFHFAALSYVAPRKVQVRYQLEGYDPVWVEAGDRRSVFYRNLKAGKYVFRVQACNADQIWNTAGDIFEVALPPAFYQTTWSKAFCGLLGLAVVGGAYGWRIRRLKTTERKLQEANDLLEAKVRERTGELANASAAMKETHNQLVLAS
ncbi:MAG TPA: two-component regulator propeller domain-containing protein, partial [Verrucomicrobiae bacterium]|nr:two-component regulator propeller domain-containing protein [Verrucomicrobiae bacterium]